MLFADYSSVAFKTDATHIFNDYNVVVVNTKDLRWLAKSNLVRSNLVSVTCRRDGEPAGETFPEGRHPIMLVGERSSH